MSRQLCETDLCTAPAVAMVSTGVRGDGAFVCAEHAPADVSVTT